MNLARFFFRDDRHRRWRVLEAPVETLVARTPDAVPHVLRRVASAVEGSGLHAAGYVAYEAAPAFDASFRTRGAPAQPLAAFGLFREPRYVEVLEAATGPPDAHRWHLDVEKERYAGNVRAIREEIARGNCYQVNYTVREHAGSLADPWELFLQIGRDAPYGAYLEFEDFAVVSGSPELFFALDRERIYCRPMKGTAQRGMTAGADAAIADALRSSAKNRAENIMIADMVRNDLGRIAHPGSVRADSLCELEKFATVWQMTSSISARTSAGLDGIFGALFPCASVTGAPKTAAMALIAALEDTPRGIYTGAIGWLAPGRQACFSVAIRTAVVDRHSNTAHYGVGGGIVWDSDADDEWEECRAKARVLATASLTDPPFDLLETLRWTPGEGYFLRDLHLDRLCQSARYFDVPVSPAAITEALETAAAGFEPAAQRVRLRVDAVGVARIEATPLPLPAAQPGTVCLAKTPVDERNPFLYHKTTRREVYADAMAGVSGCDDVLLWNREGWLTESTRANLVVVMAGKSYTPPVACGLLAGTYRRFLLETTALSERRIHRDELPSVEAIALINSVRGRIPVRLVPAADDAA